MKFFEAIKMALIWNKALRQASRMNFKDSFSSLSDIYSSISSEIPSNKAPYEINALCSFVALKMGNYDLSIKSSLLVISQMENNDKNLSNADKIYIREYSKIIIDSSAYKAGIAAPIFNKEKIESEFRELKLNSVKSHIKSKFPI